MWDIVEVYSNADGSVQFIELFTSSAGQQVLANRTITSTGNTFTFPNNSPTPTNNKRLLIATPNFADLPGAVTPNYTLPVINFFSPAGDTINFASSSDVKTFTSLPTDGVASLNYPGASTANNSPTNFAGQVGFLMLVDEGLAGDYNDDGVVNAADYVAWRNALEGGGSLVNEGDNPGTVDQGDYDYWVEHFGETAGEGGTGGSVTIPEPATFLVSLVLLVRLLSRKRPLAA